MGRAMHEHEGTGRVGPDWEQIDQPRDWLCILSPPSYLGQQGMSTCGV